MRASAHMAWAALLLLTPLAALAGNVLEQIAQFEQEGTVILSLRFRQPPVLADIRHFSTEDPARLVFDFAATDRADALRPTPAAPATSSLLTRWALASDSRRLRLQLNLRQAVGHTLQVRGQVLDIALRPQRAPAGPADRIDRSDGSGDIDGIGDIGDITFVRGAAGQAQISIVLPSAATQVVLRQSNQQLVADIETARLPPHLRRRQELGAHDTPATHLTALRHGNGTRLVIATRGQWRYQSRRRGQQLLLELYPEAGPALRLTPSGEVPGTSSPDLPDSVDTPPEQRLSLNFHDIEVRTALQLLADFTGTNLVAADSVSGRMSLRLHELPWRQVLQTILTARGLDMRQQGEVIWVAPRDELLARERIEREQRSAIEELAPLHAQAFQLNYQRADTLRRMLGAGEDGHAAGGSQRPALLSRRGRALVDVRTNQLFVTDTLAVLDNVRRMLARIDVAARQVLIEARIVEADDRFGRELGVRLGLVDQGRGVTVGNTLETVRQASGQAAGPGGDSDAGTDGAGTPPAAAPAIALAAGAVAGHAPASFALTLFNAAAQRFLNIELSALEAEGRGHIVASPRVVTADQQAALIEQGEEIPYQQSIGSGASSTSFKKANLKLEVTPQITPDGNVILDVDVNKDSRGASTPNGLAINTKHVRTQVQVEDGGTVVIGGIYTQIEREREARVPLLGELPLLGALFRHRARVREKTELLIFLTPRVVGQAPIGSNF